MEEPSQLELLRLQADLRARLRDAHDVRKTLVYGLRVTRELFAAAAGAVATLKPGRSRADVVYSIPRAGDWDEELLTRYIRGTRPRIPENTLLAPVKRRGRCWAVVALRYADRGFTPGEREALFAITQTLTEIIRGLDERRSRTVRRKIELKIAEHREPKDLIYDLLHGLRSLTRYDHSAALLIARQGSLVLVAEQIAWTKAKSRRIGLHLDLDRTLQRQLRGGAVRRFERTGDDWLDPRGGSSSPLPQLLAIEATPNVPPEVSMLCAPIATPEGAFAVLKISARRRGVLGGHEAKLVEEFLPLASLAVQFSVRTESLQKQVLQSERKHALANLTRGIAHDVNNALGAMLPLVQQMRDDAAGGGVDPATLADDLQSLETSLQTCRRIFGGMLAIARGTGKGVGHGNLRRAIDGALSVLGDSLKRRSIEVTLDLPKELPTIRGSQGDLTQLILNLCTNSRDAMTEGGELKITAYNSHGRAEGEPAERRARRAGGAPTERRAPTEKSVQVTVEDTGCGIPDKNLDRVSEPFFTTKAEGNGLGLSICRSILWDIGGELKIDTTAGEGTKLHVSLPVLADEGREAAG